MIVNDLESILPQEKAVELIAIGKKKNNKNWRILFKGRNCP